MTLHPNAQDPCLQALQKVDEFPWKRGKRPRKPNALPKWEVDHLWMYGITLYLTPTHYLKPLVAYADRGHVVVSVEYDKNGIHN